MLYYQYRNVQQLVTLFLMMVMISPFHHSSFATSFQNQAAVLRVTSYLLHAHKSCKSAFLRSLRLRQSLQLSATKPSKERPIRRIGTADTLCIATMVQITDAFKQSFTHQEQKLTKGLRDTVAVLATNDERQTLWDYETERGWVAHSAEITAALKAGYKVKFKLYDATVSLQRLIADLMTTSCC
jgi:hypothetical protein